MEEGLSWLVTSHPEHIIPPIGVYTAAVTTAMRAQ